MIYADTKPEIEAKRKAFVRKWRLKCPAAATAWRKQATSCSPSPASRKANGNRSEPRMRSSDCTKSSNGGSRPRPCCPRRKQQPCCSGLCWLLARSQCARWTAGEASTKGHPIRRLTSPHDRVTSSRWRPRQNQFQHKSRRHPRRIGFLVFPRIGFEAILTVHEFAYPNLPSPLVTLPVSRRSPDAAFFRDVVGVYPLPTDHDGSLKMLLQRSRLFFEDLPAIRRRRESGNHNEVLSEKTRGKRPRYYLQNFHFQSGGWMTDESAQRYDTRSKCSSTAPRTPRGVRRCRRSVRSSPGATNARQTRTTSLSPTWSLAGKVRRPNPLRNQHTLGHK